MTIQKKKSKQRSVSKKRAAKPADKSAKRKTGPSGENIQHTVKPDSSALNIALEAVVTISEAGKLKDQLQGYLDLGADLTLDAGQVHMIDTAGLQLLLAFVVEVKNQNRSINWKSISPAFKETVELLGLMEPLGIH